jgi:glycosyltransferase involved in cell wall biosynthesis
VAVDFVPVVGLGKMQIALVTPYNARSSISSWAYLTTMELDRRGHAVTVIRAESSLASLEAPLALPPLRAPGRVLIGQKIAVSELKSFDVIVYALGNHFGHHAEVPRFLAQEPGVVVLHDADLTGFHHGWATACYQDDMPPPDSDPTALLAWFAERSIGAVVHAQFYLDVARQSCTGPSEVIRLSHVDLDVPPPRSRLPESDLVVATIGDANINKRHTAVIEAIGRDQALRARTEYRVLGFASPDRRAELQALAEILGVRLSFSGWLQQEDLRSAIANVDVLCCLRWPITEGASGSAILGMFSGRPIIVPDIGSFTDLPDEFVMRVPAGDEVSALISHLLMVFKHPGVGTGNFHAPPLCRSASSSARACSSCGTNHEADPRVAD